MHYLTENLKIYVYAMPVLDSRMYIVLNDQHPEEALIVDPLICDEALPVLRKLSSATILLTHSHYDHISGVNWLREQSDCRLICSEICAKKIASSHLNLSAYSAALIVGKSKDEQAQCMKFFDLDYSCQADQTFPSETGFTFGSFQVEIICTPGHSDCSQCIRLTPNNGVDEKPAPHAGDSQSDKNKLTPDIVFTGDSLIHGYSVITRLPGGSKKDYNTITKPYLDSLPDDVLIMPGHGDWGKKGGMFP